MKISKRQAYFSRLKKKKSDTKFTYHMGKAHKKLYNWQTILYLPHYRNGVHHPVENICLYCGELRDVSENI